MAGGVVKGAARKNLLTAAPPFLDNLEGGDVAYVKASKSGHRLLSFGR